MTDRIGRLGLIGQYAGQRLAVELVPALGAMAQAMTDSLREGGRLRAMIDGLADNLERLGTYVAVAVTGFGVRYVWALALATGATKLFSGALVFLKGALIRTGIGALIVGAGELVYWLGRVVGAAGGVSKALSRLYDVGEAVFFGVGKTAWGLMNILSGVASSIVGSFVAAFARIGKAWDMLVNGMGAAFSGVTGIELGTSDVGGAISDSADALFEQAVASIKKGEKRIADAGKAVADAVTASLEPIGETAGDLGDGTAAAARLSAALGNVSDGAGGAGQSIKKIKPALTELQRGFQSFKSSVASAFEGLITGASSFKEALAGVLSSLASILAKSAVSGLFSGFKIPGFAVGTPSAPGGLAGINERGGELINLPRGSQVIPHDLSKRMIDRSVGGTFAPVYNIDARGADAGAVQRLERGLAKANAEFESRVIHAITMGKKRRMIT